MAPARLLQRNVRPIKRSDYEESDENEGAFHGFEEEQFEASAVSEDENVDAELDVAEEVDTAQAEAYEGIVDGEESSGKDTQQLVRNVSFGALLQAHDALSKKRKREGESIAKQDNKFTVVRARLQEMKSESKIKKRKERHEGNGNETARPKAMPTTYASINDSAPSEEGLPSKSRSSKHAPTAQSSKRQVTRKRVVVDVPKRTTRDPRFDAFQQRPTPTDNSEKAYSFLREYQKAEIAELKAAIKQTRNEEDKDTLQRKVISMENRLKSKEAKERSQEVLRQHRKEEKQKVLQGKKPFYLKKKDVKDRTLVEKFKGMKSKDREKLMEKRRRKESQREMKMMPDVRRVAG